MDRTAAYQGPYPESRSSRSPERTSGIPDAEPAPRILVVESESQRRQQLFTSLSRETAWTIESIGTTDAVLEQLDRHGHAVLVVSSTMNPQERESLIHALSLREHPPALVELGNEGNGALAGRVPQAGAIAIECVVGLDQLRRTIHSILEDRLQHAEVREVRKQLRDRYGFDNVLSKDPRMFRIFELIARLSWSNATVLIEGETGTGKEQIARAIHNTSTRVGGPLIALNCAALPEGLLGSELFGHEKGAFTNAIGQRQGRFELAHGGTLFLDEVGDIPPTMQAQLLRVLQEKQFERLGGTETLTVDVRVIAATNRPLDRMVRKRQFRQDLYYRLNVIKIDLPPLRERPGDVPLLTAHFAEKCARGRAVKRVSPQAMEVLTTHAWPGNVRQLENAIERASVAVPGREILLEHLPSDLLVQPGPELLTRVTLDRPLPQLVREAVAALEEQYLRKALQQTQGNVSRSARLCGLSRRSMRAKMIEYKLDKSQFKYP